MKSDETRKVLIAEPGRESGAMYRVVWRWHFYAGLFTAPFAMLLAITGAIYLWKPQYEAWRYRDLLNVPVAGPPQTAEAQFAAAQALHPSARAITFTPAPDSGRTSETVLRLADGDTVSVFVDPARARVVGERRESERWMTTIHDLHGELLSGRAGQLVVELAASWVFVLLLTGFYLWWPRPRFSWWGFVLPRLRGPRRIFWRDLHAVTAVWFSVGALFLLATGIPWTVMGGGWLRVISSAIGEGSPREADAGAQRSELTGWSPPLRHGLAERIDALASAPDPHAHHHGPPAPASHEAAGEGIRPPRITIDEVMAIARQHDVPEPYAVAFPVGPTGVFSAISDRNRAFSRTYLHLDQYSGRVLADVRYADFGRMGKFFLWGIIAHEGQLFGLANQIAGTVAAIGVFLISVSGVVLWWQRRPGPGVARAGPFALPRAMKIGFAALACLLPLFAASVAALWLLDRGLSRGNSFEPQMNAN